MFGYVLPRKDRLPEEEFLRYRAAYCGLCRSLKEHYGFRSRFLVNYDMTFLFFLLSPQKEDEKERCFCPARPFCKRDCLPQNDAMVYGADLTVLLSYRKLMDAKQDSRGFKALGASLGLCFYRRAYKKAAERRPKENALFQERLEALQALEEDKCPSIDRAADAFASMLKACAGEEEGTQRRIKEALLYHVGRYLYLVDALEDLPKDRKKGSYNPLCYRYEVGEQGLSEDDLKELKDTIEGSVSMAASALELLEPGPNTEILRNIIYYGLPAVLQSVSEGSFRKRRSKHERSL